MASMHKYQYDDALRGIHDYLKPNGWKLDPDVTPTYISHHWVDPVTQQRHRPSDAFSIQSDRDLRACFPALYVHDQDYVEEFGRLPELLAPAEPKPDPKAGLLLLILVTAVASAALFCAFRLWGLS